MKELTNKQQLLLDFMRSFFLENDQLPTVNAIKDHFGWKSNNAVSSALWALESKGRIERNAVGRFRFSRNVKDQS